MKHKAYNHVNKRTTGRSNMGPQQVAQPPRDVQAPRGERVPVKKGK